MSEHTHTVAEYAIQYEGMRFGKPHTFISTCRDEADAIQRLANMTQGKVVTRTVTFSPWRES